MHPAFWWICAYFTVGYINVVWIMGNPALRDEWDRRGISQLKAAFVILFLWLPAWLVVLVQRLLGEDNAE